MQIAMALRLAFRQFRRQPLYACASAGTLALAVAAAVASFAVVRPALLDPLPYRDGDRLVTLLTETEGVNTAVSAHVLQDLTASASPLEGFASIRPAGVTLIGEDATESLSGNIITASYFDTLGVRPAVGRSFGDGERNVVVISWAFWQRAFAGDAGIVGRRLLLDGADRTVVGVMPQGFLPPYWPRTDVWVPLDMGALLADPVRGRRTLTVIARRTSGQTEVEAFLATFSAHQRERFPIVHGKQSWIAEPLRDELVGVARPALVGTGAAAVLLLLIVCANIAGLAAVRAVGLRQQTAMRTALGATRGRLLTERLTDSLAIATVGSLAGVWLAYQLVSVVAGYQQQFLDRISPIAMDLTTALVGVASGLVIGTVAALVLQGAIASGRVSDALRGSRGGSGDRFATAMRSGLVVAQVALALVLIVGAGLLIRTVENLSSTALGFRSENLLTFGVNLASRYPSSERQIQFERAAVEELRRIPGVTMAHASVGVPVIGGMGAALAVFGQPTEAGLAEVAYMSVAPGYLESIGVQLKAGRHLAESDHAKAPPVVVINETMARTYWPAGDALGARARIGSGSPNEPWITIVGIIADLRQHGPTEAIRPTAFGSTWQYSFPRRNFTLRTAGTPASLGDDVRAAMRKIDPMLAVGAIQPFDQLVAERTARHRLVMLALTLFGGVSLVLCAFGLYAVVALTSQLRRREYAIRMALGAPRQGVRWMVLRQALALAAAGTIAGVAIAAGGTRTLQGLLHGVAPLDGATFALAVTVVLVFSTLSAWWPARQAGRVDPGEALKTE